MDEKTMIYLAVSLLIVVIVLADSAKFGIIGAAIAILSVFAVLIIVIMAFADYIIFPAFTRIANIVVIPSKNYVIPKSQDAIMKYTNGIYYATGYLTGNIYKYVFAQENVQDDEQTMAASPEKWEKAIMNIHFPFKFNVIAASEDIQKYRDDLEAKRGLLEFQYSKETNATNPSPMGLEALQRQINVIQARIDRIGEGEKPVNSILYIETTAVGVSEKEAMDRLANQLSELQTVFNIFDLSISRVMGREMYLLHNMNYRIPSLDELSANFDVQR